MTRSMTPMALASPETICWVKEADEVIVVDERRGTAHLLTGLEAAVWSWLTLAYPYPKLVCLTAALLSLAPPEAEQRLDACLRNWQAAGLLEPRYG